MASSSIHEERPALKTAIVREWLYAIRNFKPLGHAGYGLSYSQQPCAAIEWVTCILMTSVPQFT